MSITPNIGIVGGGASALHLGFSLITKGLCAMVVTI